MLKRIDTAVSNTIQDFLDGSFTAGLVRFDLANDGVDYATSGGFIDDIIDPLEVYRAQIINDTIQVPDTP
jgi:basic membrane protein A